MRICNKNLNCCRAIQVAEDNGASFGHDGGEERPGDAELQGGRSPGPGDPVVQRRRTGAHVEHGQQVPPGPAAVRVAVLPADGEQQEGAGLRRVLVRGQEPGRTSDQQERHAASRG